MSAVSAADVLTLYSRWAQCIRDHGVQIADPQINSNGQIEITALSATGDSFKTADSGCQAEHAAARLAARGSVAETPKDPAKSLEFSKCMRSHGLADFPDPDSRGGISINISAGANSDLSPDNPTFQAAQSACGTILSVGRAGGEVVKIGGGTGGANG